MNYVPVRKHVRFEGHLAVPTDYEILADARGGPVDEVIGGAESILCADIGLFCIRWVALLSELLFV